MRDKVERFLDRMTDADRMLVVLKGELYDGSWDELEADMQARLMGEPYIFKLASRIEDDLRRIQRLRRFEVDNDLDLCDHVRLNVNVDQPGPTDQAKE